MLLLEFLEKIKQFGFSNIVFKTVKFILLINDKRVYYYYQKQQQLKPQAHTSVCTDLKNKSTVLTQIECQERDLLKNS